MQKCLKQSFAVIVYGICYAQVLNALLLLVPLFPQRSMFVKNKPIVLNK